MARRQVSVQLDDELVLQLDRIASALGVNRSELLRRGARAVIAAEHLADADRQLQAGYRRRPQDPTLVEAGRQLADRTGPAW